MTPTPLPLEVVARLRAALDANVDPEGALRGAATSRDAFAAAESALLEQIADDLDRGETARLQAFRHVYSAARAALGAPPLDATEQPATTLSSRHPQAPSAEPSASPQPPPPPAIPTATPDSTVDVDARAIRAALAARGIPFDATRPTAPPAPTPVVRSEDGETVEADAAQIRAALAARAVPFPRPPAPPNSAPPPRASDVGPRQIITADMVDAMLRAPPRAAAPQRAPELPSPIGKQTAFLDNRFVDKRGELPFQRGATPSPPVGSPPVAYTDRQTVALAESPAMGASTLPPHRDAAGRAATPFPAQSPETLMPLERYAEITVALERDGKPLETFQRFGLDPSSWMKILRAYNVRLAADTELKARFDALIARMHGR
ncbi:MAG TPA: hypothetical protein VL400_09110 [Polyangiaceae bacterium]|jgi:hypothetical protein|nr:hypothetical protein [Polyangiaceae bacterium]